MGCGDFGDPLLCTPLRDDQGLGSTQLIRCNVCKLIYFYITRMLQFALVTFAFSETIITVAIYY